MSHGNAIFDVLMGLLGTVVTADTGTLTAARAENVQRDWTPFDQARFGRS